MSTIKFRYRLDKTAKIITFTTLGIIASAIVGGTSMSGGSGSITGTLLGAFVIQTLTSGLEFLDVPFYYKFIVQGAVIVIAVYIDIKRKEIAARRNS